MEKQCKNKCPKCGESINIDWGKYSADGEELWYDAHCRKCSCDFREVHKLKYYHTEIC